MKPVRLEKRVPEKNQHRFYRLLLAPTLFGEWSLIREWGKLLRKHPVSLCFGGHDHTLQHLRVENYPCSFIVSGAGGAKLYDLKPSERGYTNNKHLGFNHMHVTRDALNVQFLNADGECLHHFQRDVCGNVKVLS